MYKKTLIRFMLYAIYALTVKIKFLLILELQLQTRKGEEKINRD